MHPKFLGDLVEYEMCPNIFGRTQHPTKVSFCLKRVQMSHTKLCDVDILCKVELPWVTCDKHYFSQTEQLETLAIQASSRHTRGDSTESPRVSCHFIPLVQKEQGQNILRSCGPPPPAFSRSRENLSGRQLCWKPTAPKR